MLLSNLTQKSDAMSTSLLAIPKAVEGLVDVFVQGVEKEWNKNANYHFLASTFANLTTLPKGRETLLSLGQGEESAVSRLCGFTQYPDPVRRGGVASTLK